MNRPLAALLLLFAAAAAPPPPAAPSRVVSLNLCTDQMLVLLAPERIAALSPLARDPALSFVAARAAHLPVVRASAEAVLALHPDLILAGRYGAGATLAVLRQAGLPVLTMEMPDDFAGIRAETRDLAAALGVPARGERLIAAMDTMLAAVRRPPLPPPRALVLEPRGYTAGPDTLAGAVLRAAGYANAARGARTDLEALLRHPPDLLVEAATPAYPSLATAFLDHPALAGISRRRLPAALTICAGPFTAGAVALLDAQ